MWVHVGTAYTKMYSQWTYSYLIPDDIGYSIPNAQYANYETNTTLSKCFGSRSNCIQLSH